MHSTWSWLILLYVVTNAAMFIGQSDPEVPKLAKPLMFSKWYPLIHRSSEETKANLLPNFLLDAFVRSHFYKENNRIPQELPMFSGISQNQFTVDAVHNVWHSILMSQRLSWLMKASSKMHTRKARVARRGVLYIRVIFHHG